MNDNFKEIENNHSYNPEDIYKVLAENIDQKELLNIIASKENKEYIELLNKYTFQRSITFDMVQKTIEFNFSQHKETHPIGELLVLFLEVDFSNYEYERLCTIDCYNDPTTDFDLAGFPRTSIPPFWEDTFSRWGITKEEFSKKAVIDKLIKFNIYLHPYLTFYMTDKLMVEDGNLLLTKKCDLLSLQKQIADMMNFSLDVDYDERLRELTAMQRYYIYRNTKLNVSLPQFMSELFLYPYSVPEKDRHIFRTQKTMDSGEILNSTLEELVTPNPLSQEQIDYVKKIDLSMRESYLAYDAPTIAYLELFKMIQHNLMVKKCAYCGRYFVLKYNYENKYCDRIPQGESKKCQNLGAMKDFQEKIKSNPANLAYRKAYKKINDYKNKGTVTEKTYKEWIPVAKAKLNDCLNEKIPLADFELWLQKNARGVKT